MHQFGNVPNYTLNPLLKTKRGFVDPGQWVHLAEEVDVEGKWSYINRFVGLKNNTIVYFYAVAKCTDNKIRSRFDQYFVVGLRNNGSLYIRRRNRQRSVYGYKG